MISWKLVKELFFALNNFDYLLYINKCMKKGKDNKKKLGN